MRIAGAEARHHSVPIESQVKTAFGVMDARHAVFLAIEDADGRRGVGESWVNFPAWAHRERLAAFEEAVIPYLRGKEVGDIPEFVAGMWKAFEGQARQSGTRGPLLGALCAAEIALWDLAARRAGKPLAKLLFEDPTDRVKVYASGINSPLPKKLIDEHLARGVKLFKLKLGFGDEADHRNLAELRKHLGADARMAVDVNRGWSFDQAAAWLAPLADYDVKWIEEPLREADEHRLSELREKTAIPIAGGENVMLFPEGDVKRMWDFDVVQPDLTKYAPLHVALEVLKEAGKRGKRVVPHFLGSAPGLAAALHFAAGCPGALCELDLNPNPLRTGLTAKPFTIEDGAIAIPDRPGLGWEVK